MPPALQVWDIVRTWRNAHRSLDLAQAPVLHVAMNLWIDQIRLVRPYTALIGDGREIVARLRDWLFGTSS